MKRAPTMKRTRAYLVPTLVDESIAFDTIVRLAHVDERVAHEICIGRPLPDSECPWEEDDMGLFWSQAYFNRRIPTSIGANVVAYPNGHNSLRVGRIIDSFERDGKWYVRMGTHHTEQAFRQLCSSQSFYISPVSYGRFILTPRDDTDTLLQEKTTGTYADVYFSKRFNMLL